MIVDPKPRSWPDQIAQRIAGESFTVVMRRHARRPLLLSFKRGGKPVAGLLVSACVTPCGRACCGKVGTTDSAGALTIDEFYPEEYDRVFVPVKDDSYEAIWEIDPRAIRNPHQRQVVRLPR